MLSPGTLGQLPDAASLAHALIFGGQPGIAPIQLPPPHLPLTLPSPQQPALNASTPGVTLSPKIAEEILKGQFVDMTELLPDSWCWEDASIQLPSHRPPRRPPVTEITVWVECFALMASVVISRFPEKAQHMFQYLRTIVCASRNFEGTAWLSYDAAFRWQAAIHGSFDWGATDPTLYNEAFTGWARIKARCSHCLSDTHGSRSCPLALEDWQLPRQKPDAPSASSGGIPMCGLFNSTKGNSCHYSDCRYAHICSNCRRGSHPASQCPQVRRRQSGMQQLDRPQAP